MNEELIFSIGGEGESVSIYLCSSNADTEKFIVKHWSMFDDDEDKFFPDKEFSKFEDAFADIKRRRSWFRLHITNEHPDYKDIISKELKEAILASRA